LTKSFPNFFLKKVRWHPIYILCTREKVRR